MAKQLATPLVLVNNEPVPIKPNSVSYTEGFGERTTRVKSTGGSSKTIINTQNVETELSMVKFTVYAEDVSVKQLRDWLNKGDTNTVRLVDENFQRTFAQAIITNNPEPALGVEGEYEVEFQSKPAKG